MKLSLSLKALRALFRAAQKAEEAGQWVTTSSGGRLFIGEDGVARTGPGGQPIGQGEAASSDISETHDWRELDKAAAEAEGVSLRTPTDPGVGDRLGKDLDAVDKRMQELEDAGEDESREWKSLAMMQAALYKQTETPLSRRKYRRTAVVYKDGDIVGAGTMEIDGSNGHISHIGATERGTGKYVLASLVQQASNKGLRTVTADATPDAVRLMKKFGFEQSGPDGVDGTPMKLKI